jgi:two-component system sensor histidine kinase KdpD
MDPETEAVAGALQTVPTLTIDGAPVIDVASILRRHPQVALVDGLAYDNPPGSRHPKRYQDVDELLDAGICVITSINLAYITEQQDFVRSVTGKAPTQAVPRDFINSANEVVIVDAPPEADTPLQAQQLSQLRQRALLLTADVVDRQLEAYLLLHGIESSWGTQERILVCMTPRANAAVLLASARRNADRFHGELFAVYVNQPDLTPEDRSALSRNVMLARAQQAQVDVLDGKDPIKVILDYARIHGITQIFAGHNLKETWRTRLTGGLLDRLIDEAEGMDVRIFPH